MTLTSSTYMTIRTLVLAAASAWMLGAQVHPALLEVKTVYLLPMGSGLDQYLAQQLTRAGRFEVVTDPQLADAVFTDRLGQGFEEQWDELYPPPPPPPAAETPKEGSKEMGSADFSAPPIARISSFSRGRGNVFLVSRRNSAVIWSHFQPAKRTQARELHRTADRIVGQLEKDLKKGS